MCEKSDDGVFKSLTCDRLMFFLNNDHAMFIKRNEHPWVGFVCGQCSCTIALSPLLTTFKPIGGLR